MDLTPGTRTARPGHAPTRPCRHLPAGVLLACLTAATAVLAAEPTPTPARSPFFSVIGAVPAPATFPARRGPVLLGELIDRAGGLDTHASGTVRIFQHDRLQQEFRFEPGRRIFELTPGDVIVVDSTTIGPHAGNAQRPDYCAVACLNLLDRPLVRYVPPAGATLGQLLKSLGQPETLAASVRVMRKSRLAAGVADQLISGDVLVFDRSRVDQVALQAAFAREPPRDVQPLEVRPMVETGRAAAEGTTATRTPEALTLPSVSPVAAIVSDSQTGAPVARRASLEIISPFPAGEPVPAPPMDSVAVAAPARSGPFIAQSIGAALEAATVPDNAGMRGDNAPAVVPAPRPPQEAVRGPLDAQALARGSAASQSRPTPPTPRRVRNPSPSSGMTTAIAAGLSTFVGLTLLSVWSRRNRKRRVDLTASPIAAMATVAPLPAMSTLDEIINDTLPLVEEDPAFPDRMTFQGRTLGFRYLLLSGPHGLHGPHFAAEQINPRLRDRVRREGARTSSRPLEEIRAKTPPAETDERRDAGDGPTTGIEPSQAEARPQVNSRRQPSPLERALLAQRGRHRP